MIDFYYELLDRIKYVQSLEDSEEKDIRLNELNLITVRVQQILLSNIKNK